MKIDDETLELLKRYCGDGALSQANYDELEKLTDFVKWQYDWTNKELIRLSLRPYISIRVWSDNLLFWTSYKREFHANWRSIETYAAYDELEKTINDEIDEFIEAHGGYRHINIKEYILFKMKQMKNLKKQLELMKFKNTIGD